MINPTKLLLQIKLLLYKNLLIAIRSWQSTLIEILSPVFFILILLIISKAPSPMSSINKRPTTYYDSNLPACKPYAQDRCFTLVYTPSNSPLINDIISILAQTNVPQLEMTDDINSTTTIGIIAMDSIDEIFDFVLANPNVTMGGIEFQSLPTNFSLISPTYQNDPILEGDIINYNIIWNSSCPNIFNPNACPDWSLPINSALQRALNIFIANSSYNSNTTTTTTSSSQHNKVTATTPMPKITFSTSTFPLYDPSSNSINTYGCLFFYCGAMISFVFLMYKISFEKEKHLKQGMIMMGLNGSVYWVSWFLTCLILNTLLTLITIAAGAACQFSFFLNTNFMVLFLGFFLFSVSMGQVAFFIISFIQTTKAAIGIGMTIFIVGSILQLIFSLMSVVLFSVLYEKNSTTALIAQVFLYVLPMSHFSKFITDINTITVASKYTGVRFTWSDLYLNLNTSNLYDIPQTYMSLVNMLILAIVYTVLAWYFDHVVPGNDGNTFAPWFFLMPSYWGLSNKKVIETPLPENMGDDVRDEINKANNPSNRAPVILKGLSKTYHNIFNSKKDVKAVKYLSFSIETGNITALLGHNGSGKSTTISMLTGLISPTSGDATIYGHSILNQIDKVRTRISVCPQHNILWEELTAREHLELFAELKGIEKARRKECIDDALESVKLLKVANNKVSTYSGGMMRRLSIAISTIGNPSVIFLDEPTTGLDVISTRFIWTLLKSIKKDRIIIITSHRLEEIDVLSDHIIILNHGVMACVGNSLDLKNRFGNGYSLKIISNSDSSISPIKAHLFKVVPNCKILSESAQFLNFGIPLDTPNETLIALFKSLEDLTDHNSNSNGNNSNNDKIIKDWGIEHASLNEVFTTVTKLKHE